MVRVLLLLIFCSRLAFAEEYKIYVEGMHCPLCTAMVRKALLKAEGVKSVKVTLKDKIARVKCEDNVVKDKLLEAVATTGYSGVFVP
ncbi:heavy-metal-associated domain-containing protein [Helicobacter sp. MIT 11-5569]|uniref:heavy-metal-associated domain-containing protein n=1 Tax=Helicobacter sp. MIT 11-5569 TaxID=1548151 RepID=UPI00051FE18B|nr:heavy metal-associated domain-containing protein [Helicobacter sp. MIT 11-5569]TLD82858.1 heavy-metal-associated domain-containing protein [Helicobacter sp. MIT 11-5569]